MARLSEIIESNKVDNGIPENYVKDLSTCLFCGESINIGGCWAGSYHIGVCSGCQDSLIDLLIDTLEDTMSFESLTEEDKIQYLKNLCQNRLIKKQTVKARFKNKK